MDRTWATLLVGSRSGASRLRGPPPQRHLHPRQAHRQAGKQFIRWGKADILNPTDRFAPRDYLNVVDNDFLAITAARVTYGTQSDTFDLVFAPRLTPSRVPAR